ncbi:MAG: conjugal transfer protein TraF [Sphingomonadaceae bacterium]|nr:conjugal transfer protein TraF [Sphingomonadaceae bacterium]
MGALILATPSLAQQMPELEAAPEAATVSPASDAVLAAAADQGGDFYCRRRLGTWFYCDKPKRAPRSPQSAPTPSQSANDRIKAIAAELDELKARAVLEPTTENVTAYIAFQRAQLDRASTFADVWQRAIWQNPALDYTLQRPVSTVAKRAWIDNRSADRSAVLQRIGQRYGVFYFYAQSCAACEIQAPILKSVADINGLHVQAVSMDGGPNRVFPNYFVDSGQSARMGLTSRATPSLVLFDTLTKRPIPIGTGLMAADEIMDRIFTLTNVKPGSDF